MREEKWSLAGFGFFLEALFEVHHLIDFPIHLNAMLICFPALLPFGLHMKQRITMAEISNHEWFLKNLPADFTDEKMTSNQYEEPDQPMQSIDEIMHIISEATIPPVGLYDFDLDDDDMDDLDSNPDFDIDVDSSGEIIYAV